MPAPTTSDYLNQTTPAAPSGDQNCVIQSDGGTPSQNITVCPKTATSSLRGVVKPDNSSITIAGDGTISAVGGAVTSLTTTGTSGAATLSGGVLNIPQYASAGGGGSPIFNRAAYTSSSRAFGTVYQNTSSFPLIVCAVDTASSAGVVAYTDSSATPTTIVEAEYGFSGGASAVMFVVMPGNYYKVTGSTWYAWVEFVFNAGTMSASPNLSGSRSLSTNYQNTGSGFMIVEVYVTGASNGSVITAYSDSTSTPSTIVFQMSTDSTTLSAFLLVPAGDYYKVTASAGSVSTWFEYSSSLAAVKSANLFTAPATRTLTPFSSGGPPRSFLNWSGKCKFFSVVYTSASNGTSWFASDGNSPPMTNGSAVVWAAAVQSGRVRGCYGIQMPNDFAIAYQDSDGNPTATGWYEYVLG